MRRTEQEFKAEVLRRSENFRRERTKKRKIILSAGVCACLCAVVLAVATPGLKFSSDDTAPESEIILMDALKSEAAAAPMIEPEENAPELNEAVAECPAEGASIVRIRCGDDEITLNTEESVIICDYISSGVWIMNAANCLCDYTIYVDGVVYRYHSDCGTIQDEYGQSMTLSAEDKAGFNEIVARCPMRIE